MGATTSVGTGDSDPRSFKASPRVFSATTDLDELHLGPHSILSYRGKLLSYGGAGAYTFVNRRLMVLRAKGAH
jgi:hypothetical protein